MPIPDNMKYVLGNMRRFWLAIRNLFLLVKRELPFEISKHDFKINMHCVRALKIGLPLALQEFLTQISFLALCAFVNRLGLAASSGYGVACKVVNFAMLIPSSLMQSMASFVSQNVGAGNEKRAKKAMFTGMGVGIVIGCIGQASGKSGRLYQ